MGLGGDEERVLVAGVLDELHKMSVRRGPRERQTRLGDLVAVVVVDLETVPMTFGDLGGAVRLGDQ